MANRTEDSAMTNLRGLMELESQRTEQETRARADAERERTKRAGEERARLEEMARQRAVEAESARMESELIRRAAEERVEADRLDRELKVRLEADLKSRAAVQAIELAHRERLATLEASVSRGKGVSGAAAAAIVSLAIAIVGVTGFVLHAQSQTRADIARMQAGAGQAETAPVPDNSGIRAQLAASQAHLQEVQNWIATHPANPAAPPPVHAVPRAQHPHTPAASPGSEYDHLLDNGSDPITSTGLEGGPTHPRHR